MTSIQRIAKLDFDLTQIEYGFTLVTGNGIIDRFDIIPKEGSIFRYRGLTLMQEERVEETGKLKVFGIVFLKNGRHIGIDLTETDRNLLREDYPESIFDFSEETNFYNLRNDMVRFLKKHSDFDKDNRTYPDIAIEGDKNERVFTQEN